LDKANKLKRGDRIEDIMNLSTEYLPARNAGNITAIADLGGASQLSVNVFDEFGNATASTCVYNLQQVEQEASGLAAHLAALNSFLADMAASGVQNVPSVVAQIAAIAPTVSLPQILKVNLGSPAPKV
jgi:hypothetical protein